MDNNKKRRLIIAIILVAVVLVTIGGTFAYFTSTLNNDKAQQAVLKTGTMALTFDDNDNGINEKLMFGESVVKKFKIINTGSLDASLSFDFDQLVNTYQNGSLSYNLSYSDSNEEGATYEEIISETNMPVSDEPISMTLAPELSVPAGDTYYYNLTITLNNTDFDQNADKDAVYNTRFNVGEPNRYRYYRLAVDPNGGTWKEFTAPQEYLLKNKETVEIIDEPTRTGYNFAGWKLVGISSKYEDNTFTMGIGDARLVAQWTPKKYTLTINPNEGTYTGNTSVELGYTTTIDIGEPAREGYSFIGWEVDGGVFENGKFTLTEAKNPTITAKWKEYSKYIVYHNQMNTDGNGYTVVDADTDEGSAPAGSTVTPEVKTYTGFTSPEKRSLTIQEESIYPPVLNRLDYNYERNKYNLTIDANGGTYSGINPGELYYKQSITLDNPIRNGYNFTNWSTSSGTLVDSTFTMELSEATLTANWTAKEYSVTFNANGGTVDTASKKVTYMSVYGDLPKPTYEGYRFVGWFTAKSGGTQVTSSTEYTNTRDVTLYAHWAENILVAKNSWDSTEKIWEYRYSIKKVVFETVMNPREGVSYDMSSAGDESIMSYLVPDTLDSSNYTLYVQADGKIKANQDSSGLFYNFRNLESIEGIENLDTSSVTNMHGMFYNCNSLTTLNINNFNTSKVTSMNNLFYECSSLTSLDVSKFDTSKVTDMNYIFYGCRSLTSLDVSNFNTSNVTDMRGMFANLVNLTRLDVSKLDTSKVINMEGMFFGCNKIITLDLSKLDTSNVTNMSDMFYKCTNLTSLDVSKFDTSKVTFIARMFQKCSSLTSLDISNFDTSNVINISEIFNNCSSLTTLNLGNMNTDKVTIKNDMFSDVPSTIKITVGSTTIRDWVIKASNNRLTTSNFIIG